MWWKSSPKQAHQDVSASHKRGSDEIHNKHKALSAETGQKDNKIENEKVYGNHCKRKEQKKWMKSETRLKGEQII